MSHYHDSTDLQYLADVKAAAPREFAAWARLDGTVGIEDGAIPLKYRELIALAVAHSTQCVYCLDVHTAAAVKAGASRAEVAEAALLSAALRSGGAGAHAALTMKFFSQHSQEGTEEASA
ncbi:carboxymuconolactone decarboxylase family protein [Ornithinimicrobium cavernae]|uniref:carboxymuconolactone decarboxylase family protein n=1 Tax=Ornithinimicrobium cavernae TaxID=2666047 RepID=UPI000D68D03E|nr:carboxymuconolactone decarboxylase family protein [Ornithinimicrobium cavernae]